MPRYEKTAKDKAWDRERTKLQSEIQEWIRKCGEKEATIQGQIGRIAILENEITHLKAALTELTKGEMTPDEAIDHMRKTSQARDMLSFLASSKITYI